MKTFKNIAGGRRSFSEYGIFKNIHVPILVFQQNAMHRIHLDYHVTRVDFLVLSAGFTIQRNSLLPYFANTDLIKLIPGVGKNIFYLALRRLQRRGMIALKEKRTHNRRFCITTQGMACIAAFTQLFNTCIGEYEWKNPPEFLKIG